MGCSLSLLVGIPSVVPLPPYGYATVFSYGLLCNSLWRSHYVGGAHKETLVCVTKAPSVVGFGNNFLLRKKT
jgi:hypothetical protein